MYLTIITASAIIGVVGFAAIMFMAEFKHKKC